MACVFIFSLVTPYSLLELEVNNKFSLKSDVPLGSAKIQLNDVLHSSHGKCKCLIPHKMRFMILFAKEHRWDQDLWRVYGYIDVIELARGPYWGNIGLILFFPSMAWTSYNRRQKYSWEGYKIEYFLSEIRLKLS